MNSTLHPDQLVFGIHPVVELLKAKRRSVFSIYTTKPTPKGWSVVEPLIGVRSVQVKYVTRDVLTRMAGTTEHQGIVAIAQPFKFRTNCFTADKSPFVIVLDSIQDPRNLGAIIRSAYCTGASGVVMIRKASAPLSGVAFKASAGLAEHTEIWLAPSTSAAMQALKSAGYTLYLAMLGGKNATSVSYQGPVAVVIGNEEVGISKNLTTYGTPIELPQRTTTISYNASVAAGILLFLIANQKKLIS